MRTVTSIIGDPDPNLGHNTSIISEEFETCSDSSMPDNTDSGKLEEATTSAVQHISIKPPQFSPSFCNGWFEIIEAQFHLAKISGSTTKFYHAVSALPADTITKIPSDVLKEKDYEQLKENVISAFQKSKTEIFEKLTQKTPLLGKPSDIMRDLQDHASRVGVGEDLVRHRFLQSMPETVRPVLASQRNMSSSDLGKLADDLIAMSGSGTINAVSDVHVRQNNYNLPIGLKPFYANQRPAICRAHLYYAERAKSCKRWCKFPNKKDVSFEPSSRTSSPNGRRSRANSEN